MRLLLFLICFPISLLGQNTIGLPDVINYNKQIYNAGLQNWDIKQDKNGLIYIANNEGLLSFDGKYWNLYPLPNKTIVRSIEVATDNRIYAGGQDELGYFTPSRNGQLQFHSLTSIIPAKDKSFGDVWDIVALNKNIFFRTANKLFKFSNEVIAEFNAPSEWTYMGIANNEIYAQDARVGLMKLEDDIWKPVELTNSLPPGDPVTAMISINQDSVLVTTLKHGLLVLSKTGLTPLLSANNRLFEENRIYAAASVNAEWVALATSNNGVYIIDHTGNIIQSFSKEEGLQNNNVLSIFLDNQGNLWFGLDNGIDLIAYNSAIKQIEPSTLKGSGYTAIIYNNELFLGTSNGLYSVSLEHTNDLSFSKGNFSLIKNTSGQVWASAEINNNLLIGHHEGAFIIKNKSAEILNPHSGFWNFVPLSPIFPSSRIVAGYYKGLQFFNFENGNFRSTGEAPGFKESSRFVAIDKENNIWVSHPYHGVYRILEKNGQSSVYTYTDKNGLPSTLENHIYKIKNEVVVATQAGVFIYNASKDILEPSPFYRNILHNQSIRYLKEDKEGNIWFIHEKTLGVIDFTGKEPVVINVSELNNKMLSGFEFIYPVNKNNILLGGEIGFFHINYEKYKKSVQELHVHIRGVRIINKTDSLLFGGYYQDVNETQKQDEDKIPEVNNTWKTIRFEFSSPLFSNQSNLEYSFRLVGFDENWSEWTNRTEKEYTNLRAGRYSFEIKVRNNLGNESGIARYTYTIQPPWHQTVWAYILYIIIFFIIILALYRWQQKRFSSELAKLEEEQKRLQYIHDLEINKTESELIALRNEKLETEINFKNSELASSAMHLVKKGELFSKIKGELTQVIKELDNPPAIAVIKKMVKSLAEDDNLDNEWENFARHFDKVHSDFLTVLKEKHPSLSPNELKLCAYLRMNLTTKEIAQLMNISVRGVEISRYRLRKKLQIPTELGLFAYLIQIQADV